MAESTSRKQQNQAFLQELEKQRLNKDCLRIIDLRGKVAGECQAYEFGGRVHYLDDRAYLLVKQLMGRFDGRYTTGVYEALFKALKQLNEPTAESIESAVGPSFLQLDQSLQRREARTVISTPVQLRLDDVLYHGHTVDLSPHAIRVSCKRTFSLELGDHVSVEFSELVENTEFEGLRHVAYQIIKIDHDDKHTSLVLRRETEQEEITLRLSQWLEQHASSRQHDIDNELLNLQAEFYQRLWLNRLAPPLLWLGDATASPDIVKLHLTPAAQQVLAHAGLEEADWFAQLPLTTIVQHRQPLLCAFNRQHNFSVSLEENNAVQKLINWHLATANSQLLLIQPTSVTFSKNMLTQCIEAIKTGSEETETTTQLENVRCLLTIHDLTTAFSHSLPNDTVEPAQLSAWQTAQSPLNAIPQPAPLRPCIQRNKARFYIRTPVTVHVGDSQWHLDTQDVSADGLAIFLPEDASVSPNQRLHIDFSRWQTLTKKVKLDAIPYQVKNIHHWQGQKQLGLARIKNNCPESLNSFFDWVIAQNQQNLRHNHQDVITAAEAPLFSEALLPTLRSVPVFIGLNSAGQRHLRVIGKTAENPADSSTDFWLTLEQQILRWTELLKQADSQESGSLTTTLYAYKAGQQWTLALEQDFSQAREKALFIRRSLDASEFKVMLTTITVLKGQEAEQELDLQARLQQWRSQRAHRVQAIRQQLSQLVGMLELTDISDTVRQFYSR